MGSWWVFGELRPKEKGLGYLTSNKVTWHLFKVTYGINICDLMTYIDMQFKT